MSTKILDNKKLKRLQPAHGLWKQYAPDHAPYRFQATSLAEAQAWQIGTRQALAEAVGFQSLPAAPLVPQKIEEVDKGDYVREKILLRTWRDAVMPVYLLIPKHARQPAAGRGRLSRARLWRQGHRRPVGRRRRAGHAGRLPQGFRRGPLPARIRRRRARDLLLRRTADRLFVPGHRARPGRADHLHPHGHAGLPPGRLRGRPARPTTACAWSTTWRPAPTWTSAAWAPWASPAAACTPSFPPAWTSASRPAWSAATSAPSTTASWPCTIAPATLCPAWAASARSTTWSV